jgi:ribosomal protein S18 acetylase RimI-like enzyme
MSVTLRPIAPEDEEFLLRVYSSTRSDEIAVWGWNQAQQEAFLRMQFTVQQRAYEMQYGEADHHIILFQDQQVGRILISRMDHYILLVDIAVLPQYRNKGIGTLLIKELCAEAARKDVSVRLQVLKSNGAAARLYERLGFSMTGEDSIYLQMERRPRGQAMTDLQ